jgi:transcriptional regulator with XRE-family HTH domain
MDANASFGVWIQQRRKVLDLTQDELARRVGCSSLWSTGWRSGKSRRFAAAGAAGFGRNLRVR